MFLNGLYFWKLKVLGGGPPFQCTMYKLILIDFSVSFLYQQKGGPLLMTITYCFYSMLIEHIVKYLC
jgi:hypothetical protein